MNLLGLKTAGQKSKDRDAIKPVFQQKIPLKQANKITSFTNVEYILGLLKKNRNATTISI